jgi:hypothetical protein
MHHNAGFCTENFTTFQGSYPRPRDRRGPPLSCTYPQHGLIRGHRRQTYSIQLQLIPYTSVTHADRQNARLTFMTDRLTWKLKPIVEFQVGGCRRVTVDLRKWRFRRQFCLEEIVMHLLTNSLEDRLISVPRGLEVSADFQDGGCRNLRFAKLIFFHFPLAAIYSSNST